jgi:hypothetical protein
MYLHKFPKFVPVFTILHIAFDTRIHIGIVYELHHIMLLITFVLLRLYLSMALQLFVGPWTLFQFLYLLRSR